VVHEIFQPNYWPGDDPFDHLVFALKYDDFNLDVLVQSLTRLGPDRVLAHVESQPNGKYARQLGYLYELLTGELLALKVAIGGGYVDLLDPNFPRPRRCRAGWHGAPRFGLHVAPAPGI
jgi:hypothetical protein